MAARVQASILGCRLRSSFDQERLQLFLKELQPVFLAIGSSEENIARSDRKLHSCGRPQVRKLVPMSSPFPAPLAEIVEIVRFDGKIQTSAQQPARAFLHIDQVPGLPRQRLLFCKSTAAKESRQKNEGHCDSSTVHGAFLSQSTHAVRCTGSRQGLLGQKAVLCSGGAPSNPASLGDKYTIGILV